LHIQRPFFKSLCFFVLWRRLLFPKPTAAERWRDPPAQLQARPNQESGSKPESDWARAPESPSPRTQPIPQGAEARRCRGFAAPGSGPQGGGVG
jgi:hypothetical protein